MQVSEIKETKDVYSPNKAVAHLKELDMYKAGELFPPKCVQIDLEAYCPHDCAFCSYRNSNWQSVGMKFLDPSWSTKEDLVPGQHGKPKGSLKPGISGFPKELGLSLPRQMAEAGIPAMEVTGGGESLAWSWIREFFEEVIKYEREFALVTNGQLLGRVIDLFPKLKLKWLRFSMDAFTAETHAKIHGCSTNVFPQVVEYIKQIVAMKIPGAYIGISFIITPQNHQEIIGAAKFWKEIGVQNLRYSFEYEPNGDGRFKKEEVDTIRGLIEEAKKEQTPTFKVFGQADRLDRYKKPNNDFSVCGYQLFTWAIGYNGKVWPCCIVKYYPKFEMGDLHTQTLKELVNSPKRKEYMEKFDVSRCPSCWLRDRNQAIESLLAPSKIMDHLNYV